MIAHLDPKHIAWCRHHFDSIKDGGIWAIPRSGMVFTRRGDKLILTDQMPWMDTMPITAAQLREQQEREFDNIVDHFWAAGIEVEKLS